MGLSARRVVFVLLVLVGIGMGSVETKVQALGVGSVPSVGGNDYPWQNAGMYGMSPLRFAYRNCTDYVAYEINKQLGGDANTIKFDWSQINSGGNGNASAWKNGAEGKYMVDDAPIPGSIAWWGGSRANGYGHVALVTSVSEDGDSITMDEYNSDMTGHFTGAHQVIRDHRGWPQAFIHVADSYADGTYLESDTDNTYVTAGGAAIPVPEDELPEDADLTPVMQHQIDTMPTVPRDGTYLQNGSSDAHYMVSDGRLTLLTNWSEVTDFSDDTDLVTRYLQPARTSPNPFDGKGPVSSSSDDTVEAVMVSADAIKAMPQAERLN